jgi:hypothetical protein
MERWAMRFSWIIGIVGGLVLSFSQVLQATPRAAKSPKAPQAAQIIKLKPQIRAEAFDDSGISIPLNQIKPFLQRSLILDQQKQFEQMPYVLSEAEGRALSGAGSILYVRGVKDKEESLYDIYSKVGRTYRHPKTHEILGFEAFAIGTANLQVLGDPATFEIQNAEEIVESGARLAPSFATELPLDLKLKPADTLAEGYILAAKNSVTGAGAGHVVTISMGHREGLSEGNTLAIYRPGKVLADPMGKKGWRAEKVSLPDRRIGQLLVFQSYEKLSLALILESTETIDILDKVKRP